MDKITNNSCNNKMRIIEELGCCYGEYESKFPCFSRYTLANSSQSRRISTPTPTEAGHLRVHKKRLKLLKIMFILQLYHISRVFTLEKFIRMLQ